MAIIHDCTTGDINEVEDVVNIQSAEEIQLQTNATAKAYLESTAWYAERGYDFIISNGQYGAPMPDEIIKARQEARDSIK